MRMQIVLTLREVLNVCVSQVTLEMEKIVKVKYILGYNIQG